MGDLMASDTDEMLTIEEIYSRYHREWVLLLDPVKNEFHELVGGRVLLHHPHRAVLHERIMALRPKRFATFFAGPVIEEDGEEYAL